MSKYKGLFTFDEDNHRYIPIAQADEIIDTMGYEPDSKPAEPLIKDEKVRKAVRAWAKLNTTESEIFKISMIDRCTLSIGNHGPRFETWNNTYYDNLQRGREYTIAELCGEEEEG